VVNSLGRSSLSVWDASLVIGAIFEASQSLSFGLRIQSPTIGIHGSADEFTSSDGVSSGTLTSNINDQPGIKADYRLPLDFTLGTAIRFSESFEIVADLSYQTALKYQTIPSSTQGKTIDAVGTPRVNFGTEYQPSPTWPIRAGFFYNPSTLRQATPGSSNTQTDYYGVTAGLVYKVPHVETAIGVFDIWGSGPTSGAGTPTLVSSNVSGLGALLTTAYVF
jgi:long-subunit fatty acid transport protein